MSFQDKLLQIEQLQATISKHGKLPVEVLKKINYKFRLDWNYYSNSMEGNSLTQDETRTVMVGNITVEGKPFQDIMEMKKHDELITTIIRMGKGELNISEKRIKDIHTAIMYEEDPEVSKKIGQWKIQSNYLFNYKGERFEFVEPADVPERMHQLVNWLNAENERIRRKDKLALHPVLLALQFHLDYVTIHPFYDGNGRTSRILCNIILISHGYPPIYIKTEEREIYYRYLADIQAYGGDTDLLYDFMAGLVIRSQEIILKGIEGKEINDPEDLDKRLHLLEGQLETLGSENDIVVHLNREVFWEIYEGWLSNFFVKSIEVVQKFNRFFKGIQHSIHVQPGPFVQFNTESSRDIVNKLTGELKQHNDRLNTQDIKVLFRTNYGTFKKGGLNTFGCYYGWEIKFDRIGYEIILDEFNRSGEHAERKVECRKLLHQPLSDIEIESLTKKLGDTILTHIEENVKKLGLT